MTNEELINLLCEAAEDLMASMGCGCCGGNSFWDDAEKLRNIIEKARNKR